MPLLAAGAAAAVLASGCSARSGDSAATPAPSAESSASATGSATGPAATGSATRPAAGGSSSGSVSVAITDQGCTPDRSTVTAGTVQFLINSTGNGAVSEVELLRGSRVLAERENIAPGLSGKFSVTLAPGSYRLYCPGGSGEEYHDFSVTAG